MLRKILTGTLIGGGIIAGYVFLKRINRTQVNLEAIPKASIHKINLDGITVRVDILLKNPTKGSFSAKFPFVKLKFKGATIGSSKVVNKDITIPEYGEANIEEIMIDVPLDSAFSVVSSLLKSIQNKEPVKITATVISTVFVGPVNLPFEKDYDLTL